MGRRRFARHAAACALLPLLFCCSGGSGGGGGDVSTTEEQKGGVDQAAGVDIPAAEETGAGDPGGGGGTHLESDPIIVRLPLPLDFQNIPLQAGVPAQRVLSFEGQTYLAYTSIGAAKVDVQDSLQYLAWVPDGGGGKGDDPASDGILVSVLSASGALGASVCDSGTLYGPTEIALDDQDQPVGTAEPPVLEAEEKTIDEVNSGSLALCMEVLSPVGGIFGVEALTVEFTVDEICEDEPSDLSGFWEGTYECSFSCDPAFIEKDSICLEIVQDGAQATYTDGWAEFGGTVCGDTFRFSGGSSTGDDTCSESGKFVMAADGETATKSSNWTSGACGGHCEDILEKVQSCEF